MKASLERVKNLKTTPTNSIPYYLLRNNLPKPLRERLFTKTIGNRTAVFLGKRLIGYAVGVGVALDVITLVPTSIEQVSKWRAEDYTEKKKARNALFKEIIEDW